MLRREFKRGDFHVYRLIAGEHLLVGLQRASSEPFLAMSATGAELWKRLERWATIDELVLHLQESYEVESDVARADVEEFLGHLAELQAVQRREVDT